VDNNYLDLGMNKSGFVHTLPSGRLTRTDRGNGGVGGAQAPLPVAGPENSQRWGGF
jgi:hypothetical protein